MALSYLTLSSVEAPPSSVQQDSQSAATAARSNWRRSAQEEHSSFAELKPFSRHLADVGAGGAGAGGAPGGVPGLTLHPGEGEEQVGEERPPHLHPL